MENNGFAPEIYVGENGNWFVNGYDTGTKAQGEPGPKGDKGERGVKGDEGAVGPQGMTGATGAQGLTGPKGDTGIQGPQGSMGATGPQGLTGPKGDTGAQGPQGDPGATGPQGSRGATGPKGDQGDVGPAGPVNITNSLDTTSEGYALDARQGRVLKDKIEEVNRKIKGTILHSGDIIYEENGSYTLSDSISNYKVVEIYYFVRSNSTYQPNSSYYIQYCPVAGGTVRVNLVGQQAGYESLLGITLTGTTLNIIDSYRRKLSTNVYDDIYKQLHLYKIIGYK